MDRPPTDLSPPRPGEQFGDYRIESQVGGGRAGTVFAARHIETVGATALKLMRPAFSLDAGFVQRFTTDLGVAQRLSHPSIVPIRDFGSVDGTLFAASVLVEGSDLRRRISTDGPLSPERTVGVLEQIAHALDGAHDAGLVHGDLKPTNVLVVPPPPYGSIDGAYVTDFGHAGLSPPPAGRPGAEYLGPEQMGPAGAAVEASDVYALACLLFECLVRGVAFPAGPGGRISNLPALRPDLPKDIDGVLRRAWAEAPDERHSSCREFVAEARDVLGSSAAWAPPPAPPPPAVVGAPLLPEGFSWQQAPGSRPPPGPVPSDIPPPTAPPRKRVQIVALAGAVMGLLLLVGVMAAVLAGGSEPERDRATQPSPPPAATPTPTPTASASPGAGVRQVRYPPRELSGFATLDGLFDERFGPLRRVQTTTTFTCSGTPADSLSATYEGPDYSFEIGICRYDTRREALADEEDTKTYLTVDLGMELSVAEGAVVDRRRRAVGEAVVYRSPGPVSVGYTEGMAWSNDNLAAILLIVAPAPEHAALEVFSLLRF